ncbi:MAG: AAA family ATPase [Clostridia bacterium]|nr:AAA family ATPase [Clostridia bacterium]
MKIKSIYISAFGGVKDLKLDLNDSFNVIYGENENGKTTVMSFIKMMFYGSDRAKGDLAKSPRKKYTPWDNSQMAGSIDFEKDGKNYRLERIFGESNSTDKVTLINTDLGSRENVSADIGAKLLGLSSAAFERSIFIGQFGFPENNANAEGEINSKLSNLALTGEEDTSFDEVYKRLEKAKLALASKSGRAGEYDKNLASLKALNDALSKANETQEKINFGNQKAKEIVNEIEKLQQEANKLKVAIDKEQDFRNVEKLRELLNLKTELDNVTKSLTLENGTVIDEMFLKKIDFCLSKINGVKGKIQNLENENKVIKQGLDLALDPNKASPEKSAELEKKINVLEQKQADLKARYSETEKALNEKQLPNLALLILGIIFGLGGAALCAYNTYLGAVVALIGIILCVVFLVITSSKNAKKKELEGKLLNIKFDLNELMTVITLEKSNFNAITTALNSNAAMIENQQNHVKENNQKIEEYIKEKAVYDGELASFLGSTFNSTEIDATLDLLREKATTQKEIKQKINYILKDVGNISYEVAKQKIKEADSFGAVNDFESIKAKYDGILEEITSKKTDATAILTEIKAITKVMENPETLKKQIAELTQKTESQAKYVADLELAMEVLTESFAEVRRSYGSVLDNKTGEIFSGITGGKYNGISVSKSFDISVQKADIFGSFDSAYLSSGTVDQAYLSLRLALSELITNENGTLPIMLDDSLVQFDDKRQKTALEYLKKYSYKSQIIMFTCHKYISETAENLGATIQNMK